MSEAKPDSELQTQYNELASLAGGLVHEIRNPLSTISLNLELLTEDLVPTDARDQRLLRRLGVIRKECDQLQQVLDDFLQFARTSRIDATSTDLNETIREFIAFYQPVANESRVMIHPHLAAGLPAVMLDHNLWRQVLQNLFQNGQQAMPAGGAIEILTYLAGPYVVMEIIDGGIGMAPSTRDKIFQPFFSTRKEGSGLGLPTVKRIVEAHQGTISCESDTGRGTRFSIALPALSQMKPH